MRDEMYSRSIAFFALAALGACTPMPIGPGMPALPGTAKTFAQFQADDRECQGYASSDVAARASAASDSYALQRQYDFTYIQCMYSRGHKVPIAGAYTGAAPGAIPPPPAPQPATAQ